MTEPTPQPQGGAPFGNRNRLVHGRYSFTVGTWPKGSSYVSRLGKQLRQHLEDAVAERHDGVNLYHAALINSAVRHEMRALLLQRELRLAGESRESRETETTERQGDTAGGNGKRLKATIRTEKQTGLGIMERAQLMREISAASDSRDKCLERLGLDKSPAELRDEWGAIYAQPLPPPQTPSDAPTDAGDETPAPSDERSARDDDGNEQPTSEGQERG